MYRLKNNKLIMLAEIMAATITLTACQSAGVKERKLGTVGAFVGLVAGAASSDKHRARNALLGALVVGSIGRAIGKSMDRNDRARRTSALEKNRTNQPVAWTNPDSGNRYRITPKRTYRSARNVPCREYETEAFIRGERKVYTGKACRDNNGNWTELRGS